MPAVVQTDGGSLDRSPVGGLVLVGGLLLGAGAVVRRVVRAEPGPTRMRRGPAMDDRRRERITWSR